MAKYIYGCSQPKHPRWLIEHSMKNECTGECPVCGEQLHRIPQPFLFGLSPITLIRDWSERNWEKKLRGEPRDYSDVTTDRGKPQKDYGARK